MCRMNLQELHTTMVIRMVRNGAIYQDTAVGLIRGGNLEARGVAD